MNFDLPLDRIAKLARADSVSVVETVQSLWSGYGVIVRVDLRSGVDSQRAIVKIVCPPDVLEHKYGWTSDVSHNRKLSSYGNEIRWYQTASKHCGTDAYVPEILAADKSSANSSLENQGSLLILEDLNAAGFNLRRTRVSDAQVDACLKWLANFHATFLVDTSDAKTELPANDHGLWPIGTYWHLRTRPQEFESMEEGPLRLAASKIDAKLNAARFQTLVHGDAKLANFCFSQSDRVAAVDFQYVGGGCGMKDVAYFISSCFHEDECERKEQALLSDYFAHLRHAVQKQDASQTAQGFVAQKGSIQFEHVETEWRELYPVAWADFYRFLAGWSPGHWKMHGYSWRVTQKVLAEMV